MEQERNEINEINERLARWIHWEERSWYWGPGPDFIHSLDACYAYLLPVAKMEWPDQKYAHMMQEWLWKVLDGEPPALSLCIAIDEGLKQ